MAYADLQADIIEYSARDDISTKAPMFIRLAEAEIYRRVKVLEMETAVTLTFSTPDYDATLPTGWQGFKRLSVSGSRNPKTKYVGPDLFAEINATASQVDLQSVIGDARLIYTVEANKVKVNQPAGSAEPIVLAGTYFKRLLPLSDSNTSNVMLDDHPDLFLYAALAQLWDWADELEAVAKYTAKMDKVIGQIDQLERDRRRAAGEWSKSMPRGVAIP
jgi:hypothetical protein